MLAGIGNAYSDEILHAAKMSPVQARREALTDAEAAPLYEAMRDDARATRSSAPGPGGRGLKGEKKQRPARARPHRRDCPVCGDTIREVSFADSALQYCPTCQTGGKPLADRRMSRLLK